MHIDESHSSIHGEAYNVMDAYDERTIDVHFVTSTINPATATKANPSEEPSAALP